MKQKATWEVEVWNIEVDDFYYSFEYRVSKDGKTIREDTYESDHAWMNRKKEWKETLENGYALETALISVLEV